MGVSIERTDQSAGGSTQLIEEDQQHRIVAGFFDRVELLARQCVVNTSHFEAGNLFPDLRTGEYFFFIFGAQDL